MEKLPKKHSVVKKIFLQSHPIQRLLIALVAMGIASLWITGTHLNVLLKTIALWDVFAATMLATSWFVIFVRTPAQIRVLASDEDGSLLYVFSLIVFASFASIFTVLLLMVSKDVSGAPKAVYLPVAVAGMMLSWIMVHTTFTYHYARLYYSDDENDEKIHAGGLCFPHEDCPDYVDFAYYAFVIGMTFQVSDVETRTRKFRRITLAHSLLSFALNTFVVALTINLIASLKA
ncbi:DUF1345 domain-containing protein [Parasediminibacterium sp. JCM 36343]|uniref:DUF1345 domain-containing protein n=1 Tax=Parasediminibacterium sp. JCM 36343 TaxID=3374279 RepID=UPI00397B403A